MTRLFIASKQTRMIRLVYMQSVFGLQFSSLLKENKVSFSFDKAALTCSQAAISIVIFQTRWCWVCKNIQVCLQLVGLQVVCDYTTAYSCYSGLNIDIYFCWTINHLLHCSQHKKTNINVLSCLCFAQTFFMKFVSEDESLFIFTHKGRCGVIRFLSSTWLIQNFFEPDFLETSSKEHEMCTFK